MSKILKRVSESVVFWGGGGGRGDVLVLCVFCLGAGTFNKQTFHFAFYYYGRFVILLFTAVKLLYNIQRNVSFNEGL